MHPASCLAAVLTAGIIGTAAADTVWEDDFDLYAPGTILHDVGGWRGWDGNPAWAATVSDEVAHSGANSMSMAPDTDTVQQFEGIDCGVYPSVTKRNGNFVLWHPDRKFFLLGKKITNQWLADLKVPTK